LLAAAPAYAQKAKPQKYTRPTNVQVDVKQTERSKPRAVKDGKGDKPVFDADLALSIEGLKGKFEAEQAEILKDLIKNTPDSEVDEKADYYFRLGELYAKQQRYWRLKAVEHSIKGTRAESEAAAKKAKDFLVDSVVTYKALTDNEAFRNFPKMDVALFYYGYTLQSGRYQKEARAAYDKLLKNYPASKYVPEAHYAFAEYFFEAGQLADAEARYRKVLEFPSSGVYWHAMYKQGWIQLNLAKHQEALETFYRVAQATKDKPKHEVLNRAAKKDFVRAYAEVGKSDKAHAAFKNVDAKYAFDMLGHLADLYLEQGKSEKAIFTYHELMRLAPAHRNVCLWQYYVTQATLSLSADPRSDQVKDIVREVESLARLHATLRAKKVLPKAEADECRENASAMSGELARAYHSEAARTKNFATLAHAEKLYKVYLDVFPNAPDYAQTQYYYSELLWARAEAEKDARLATQLWETAALAFTAVVKTGKLEPRPMKEAAYAAVLGWKNALDVDPRVRFQADALDAADTVYDTVPAPKPIPDRQLKMIAAFDMYIAYIKDPKDDELVGIKFLEANIYRRYHHYDKAVPLFEDILAKHRDHETAEFSANLLLDTFNRQRNYPAMLALAEKLAADKKFMEGRVDLSERLAFLKIQSIRKAAEDKEKRGKASGDLRLLVQCGEAYLDIYNSNPEAKNNDEVLYNALVCFHEGKSVSAAIFAFNTMQRFYPSSKLMPRAVGRIGKAFGDVAFYAEASEKLEEYARKYAGEKDAYSAMNDAVLYRKGTGQDDKAIANTKYFVKTFGAKKPQIAANAHFSIASIYEKQGDGDALVRHLREYIREHGKHGGADRLVMAHAKIGQTLWAQSCSVKTVNGACVRIERERAISTKTRRRGGEQPTQCGPSKLKLAVVGRDDRKVRDAMAAFALAQKEFDKSGGKTGGDDQAGARHYYAQSRLAIADRDFEAYLAKEFPSGLNFDPKMPAIEKKSRERLDAWVTDKMKVGAKATAQYEAILDVKDAATSIAAAARIGQIQQNFSDALFTAEIPKDVRTGAYADEKVAAFCDRMTEVAEPLETRSLEAFGVCLNKSTELGWFSDWSKLCERELGQIKPDQFPTASELRSQPNQVAAIITVEGPIKRLD
jgi:tetratricopeptide (TPR) repeat protein